VGDTGSGKSYLESTLIRARDYVLVLKTKTDDDDKRKFAGFHKITTLRGLGWKWHKYLLQPKNRPKGVARPELQRALDLVYNEGGWTICADELFYLTELGLGDEINGLFTQGRSEYCTVVGCAQRQQWVSRFFLSQCTHCFFFRCEGRDAKELGLATSPRILPLFEQLRDYEFVYFNRRERTSEIGTMAQIDRILSNVKPRKAA